jgi:hypothetical protein
LVHPKDPINPTGPAKTSLENAGGRRGGYRTLPSFQTATLIYDATCHFCEKFLVPRTRLADPRLMDALSGRHNIA